MGLAIGLALLAALCCGVTAYCWQRRRRGEPLVSAPQGKVLAVIQLQQQHHHQEQMLGALPLVVSNPLAAAGHREGAPALPPFSESGVWERFSDAGDTWYVHSKTGESVWELPAGATLAAGPGTAV